MEWLMSHEWKRYKKMSIRPKVLAQKELTGHGNIAYTSKAWRATV